jgi:glycosyltransferase involved in cell wall biosynthesis
MVHISICVCTLKRPRMLERLLREVAQLRTADLFTYSVVLVDNDAQQSAKDVAVRVGKETGLAIRYDVEPERNISLARNRSVRNADGSLIAFIDDDEFPGHDWLLNHFRVLTSSGADGVLGPVRPHFDGEGPTWLVKSGLLERSSLKTGEVIRDSIHTRTGNVLIRKSVFTDTGVFFDPRYGLVGGGDRIFFKETMAKGKVFVWSNEGCVFEIVSPGRQNRSYYVKRAWSRGVGAALETPFLSVSTAKSFIAIPLYTAALPVLFGLGQHLFMRYLVKDCDHISKVLGHLGIRVVPEKPQ